MVEAADLTTNLLWCHFSAEHWHDYATSTEANACNEPSYQKRGRAVTIDGLHPGAGDENEGADGNGKSASEHMGHGPDSEAGYEGAKLLQANCEGRDAGRRVLIVVKIVLI